MLYHQYRCACCNRILAATDKECPECGSHTIRSPYGFWIFCMAACLAVAVVFQVVRVYFQGHQDTPPTQKTILQILNQERSNQ